MARTKQTARKSSGGYTPRKQLAVKAAKKINDWVSMNRGFSKKSRRSKTFLQEWVERGLTYKEAQQWIGFGWKPNDIYSIEHWKNQAFSLQETQEWINIGLNKDESDFAYYLKKQGCKSTTISNLEILRKEFDGWSLGSRKNSQGWLNYFYSSEVRKNITHLDISMKDLRGSLELNDFINLKVLDCFGNKLDSLDISSCEETIYLNCEDNQLTTFLLPIRGKKITFLSARNNRLESDLTFFSCLESLEELWIGNNKFFGSLSPLQKLTKLGGLDVGNTNVSDGLEYLPKNLKKIWCDGCEELEEKLKGYFKKDKIDYGDGKDYIYYDYQAWKRNNEKKFKQLKQLISTTRPNLDSEEVIKKLTPFNIRDIGSYNNLQKLFTILGLKPNNESDAQLIQRIKYLANLIKQLKHKIIEAYLHFAPEKKLLRKLIITHLRFTKAKKQGIPCFDYGDECWEINKEMRSKVGEELIEKVQLILNDCEDLVIWELELEDKFNNRLLEEQVQTHQITWEDDSDINMSENEIQKRKNADLSSKTTKKQKIISDLQQVNQKLQNQLAEVNSQKNYVLGQVNKIREFIEVNDLIQRIEKVQLEVEENEREQGCFLEIVEVDKDNNQSIDWQNLPAFTSSLIHSWQNQGFSFQQTRDWISVGLLPMDANFAVWLRSEAQFTPEQLLNDHTINLTDLREQFQEYCQVELQKLHSQLKLAQAKKVGQVIWEYWETSEGLEKWIKELEEKISKLEIQEQSQLHTLQPPKQ